MALPTSATPVAKSLHTLTVLQQVARAMQVANPEHELWTADALARALDVLGLTGRPDPYGLAARALALMLAADEKVKGGEA